MLYCDLVCLDCWYYVVGVVVILVGCDDLGFGYFGEGVGESLDFWIFDVVVVGQKDVLRL